MSIWRMNMILTRATRLHQIIPMTMPHTRRPAARINTMRMITRTSIRTSIRIASILGGGTSAILPTSNQ